MYIKVIFFYLKIIKYQNLMLNTNKTNESENIVVPNKQDILMESLTDFFQSEEHLEQMLPIINGISTISLRIIDWFVTNYSKKYNTTIDKYKNSNNNIKQFLVFLNYKSQLKAYTKKQFDPFCRRERINFYYDKYNSNKFIETTVGQLNFFRWSILNNVLQYIKDNLHEIEVDMNHSIRKITTKKKDNRRKRQELSVSATRTLNKHAVNVTINFE